MLKINVRESHLWTSFFCRDFMRLGHPLSCAEVEIHQVTKREDRPRGDTVDGITNQDATDNVNKASSDTTSDVHKLSLLKDFNETLFSPGNCFPKSRSRASSANSSISGGEEGNEGTSDDNIDGPTKSRFIHKKRMKPRSKSKSKFYRPSPSSSIDGIDDSDIGSPQGSVGPVRSPDGIMVRKLRSPESGVVYSVNSASTSLSGNMIHLGSLQGNVVNPIGSPDSGMDNRLPFGSPGGMSVESKEDYHVQTLELDRVSDRINMDKDGTKNEINDNCGGLPVDSNGQTGTLGEDKGTTDGSYDGDNSRVPTNNAESECSSVIDQQPTRDNYQVGFRENMNDDSSKVANLSSNNTLVNNELPDGKLSSNQLSGHQSLDDELPGGKPSNNRLSVEKLSDENELPSPTDVVIRTPSTDRFSDLISGTHSELVSPGNGGQMIDGDQVGSDPRTEILTPNNSVTEIATRQGGGPVPLSRIKCLVSMTTPRDMHLCGTTSLPGFVEFNMSLDGFGCLFLPSVAPHVPPGEKKLYETLCMLDISKLFFLQVQ